MSLPSPFDPLDYLKVARELASNGGEEQLRYELLPADVAKQDWTRNWTRAERLVQRLLSQIRSV